MDPWLSVATFVPAVLSYYLVKRASDRVLLVPDALGLGLFSTLGATYALSRHLPMVVAVLMGVVTRVFRGVMRDTMCDRVPVVFRRNSELYATCSFAGVWVFVLLSRFTPDPTLASWVGTGTVVLLRLLSVRFQLKLPAPNTAARGADPPALAGENRASMEPVGGTTRRRARS